MRKKQLLILFLFILVCLFLAIKKSRLSIWDGDSRVNFVLVSKPIVVVSLEPEKNLTILELPENLYLEVSQEMGKYQLGSVYELGELENRGGELLMKTIESYLGVPVEGYIKMSNVTFRRNPAEQASQMSNLKKSVLDNLFLSFRRGETNFSHWDLFRLWWVIRGLRSDKVKIFDLKKTNILLEKKLPDGSPILETEYFRLDDLMKNCCIDHKIYEEELRIEVLNATDHLGLANRVSRLIMNMGGNVVAVGNASIQYPVSRIKYKEKEIKKSYTFKKLEKILEVEAEPGEMGESRADLLILIGEDYYKKNLR